MLNHLFTQHHRFINPKKPKQGSTKRRGTADIKIANCKAEMDNKLLTMFADLNLSVSSIERESLKAVLQFGIEIGARHPKVKIDDVATLSRRTLAQNTKKKAEDTRKLLSEYLREQLSNTSPNFFISVDCNLDGKGFGRRHATGLTLVVTTLLDSEIAVYSFVIGLEPIKDKHGKVSNENADYLIEFNKSLLGDCGNRMKCVGDGAVIITYSTTLKDALQAKKENYCQGMAEVLQVCCFHGCLIGVKTPAIRTIVETDNKNFAKVLKFDDTKYEPKNRK